MYIKNIKIENFKSIYGPQEFDFESLKGLTKLSGKIGVGKTSLCEAIIYGLFGNVKGQNNTDLVSWNMKSCTVDINLTSKNKEVHIIRNTSDPLIVEINGKPLSASSKRDTQQILEDEIYDVPKLAIIKMCIISFNSFNSLANMNPSETKQFLDEIFGFKLFSDYNNEIVKERKTIQNETIKLEAIYEETQKQIDNLIEKKNAQQNEIKSSIDEEGLNNKRQDYINEGILEKKHKADLQLEYSENKSKINEVIGDYKVKMAETAALGKQAKNHYNTLKGGICPTCGQIIDEEVIAEYKSTMLGYADEYNEAKANKEVKEQELEELTNKYIPLISACDDKMIELKNNIREIDNIISSYKNNIKMINENYEELINEQKEKLTTINEKLTSYNHEILEWNEMNELFTKTLRYKLLERLIPQINKSIKFFINKLDQSFSVSFDQEFKAHITVDSFDREIKYNNLSTGQKKTLDLAIIFGILHNIIANVNCNILLLDELFSNMDSDTRNIMLSLLNETIDSDKTVFIINHAEMQDDYFNHKIRVNIENREIESQSKKIGKVIVKSSKYDIVF